MEIRNKLESIKKITELELNKFPEQIFRDSEETKVQEFLENNSANYYAIRDKSKAGGVFKLKVDYDKVLEEIKGYNLFTVNVSSANYVDNQLLVGEIEFLSNGEIYATLSLDPSASVRDALSKPTFNLKTDIFDKKLNEIPHFNVIYQYIADHNLYDVIVEFALFNKEVGIKREKVIVYELRTHY
ncbi:MAG: hypothetical protein NC181_04220 [Clostridium sp.]|nr:hypothetical protein [Clostridium sp.]MCM1444449.1 hypothetical protein [Candidatus Amulumruptor caecigallinarius]